MGLLSCSSPKSPRCPAGGFGLRARSCRLPCQDAPQPWTEAEQPQEQPCEAQDWCLVHQELYDNPDKQLLSRPQGQQERCQKGKHKKGTKGLIRVILIVV